MQNENENPVNQIYELIDLINEDKITSYCIKQKLLLIAKSIKDERLERQSKQKELTDLLDDDDRLIDYLLRRG